MPWKFFTSTGTEKVTLEETPIGLILPFAGTTAPGGWLLCLGQEVSRSNYPSLDSAIGTVFGAYTNGSGATGSTHLRLPDFRGRCPVGNMAGNGDRTDTNGPLTGTGQIVGGSAMSASSMGAWSGTETHTLSTAQSGVPSHNHGTSVSQHGHGANQTSHSHQIGYAVFNRENSSATFRWNPNGGNPFTFGSGAGSISPTVTAQSSNFNATRFNSADASQPHGNVSLSIVVNFMIRAY